MKIICILTIFLINGLYAEKFLKETNDSNEITKTDDAKADPPVEKPTNDVILFEKSSGIFIAQDKLDKDQTFYVFTGDEFEKSKLTDEELKTKSLKKSIDTIQINENIKSSFLAKLGKVDKQNTFNGWPLYQILGDDLDNNASIHGKYQNKGFTLGISPSGKLNFFKNKFKVNTTSGVNPIIRLSTDVAYGSNYLLSGNGKALYVSTSDRLLNSNLSNDALKKFSYYEIDLSYLEQIFDRNGSFSNINAEIPIGIGVDPSLISAIWYTVTGADGKITQKGVYAYNGLPLYLRIEEESSSSEESSSKDESSSTGIIIGQGAKVGDFYFYSINAEGDIIVNTDFTNKPDLLTPYTKNFYEFKGGLVGLVNFSLGLLAIIALIF